MSRKKTNFLDLIVTRNPDYAWEEGDGGAVTVHVRNRGFYNWLAQKAFRRPPVSRIALDEYGSFVWRQINGERSAFEISKLLSNRFGEEAEPVIGRLVEYVRILYRNRFIGLKKS